MKPPKCKLCGHEHWGVEHKFESSATSGVLNAYPASNTLKCNQCVTKDAEIQRLRNQIAQMQDKAVPKRDRAQYMRDYRANRGRAEAEGSGDGSSARGR